jgi:hypothetical protein
MRLSRILVAEGGESSGNGQETAGYAGGLFSSPGISIGGISLPISTQTEGTIDGIGENSSPKSLYKDRGAEGNRGGGRFASKATGIDSNTGGSGGSSYITGFPDCKTNFNIQFIDPSLIGGKILIFSPT